MSNIIDMSKVNDKKERTAVQVSSESSALIHVIERAARDASIDIDKVERLLAMQKEIFKMQAETAYNAAMAACQAEMPRIVPRTTNDHTNATYAALDEIDRLARPIYTKHGFGLTFGTADCPIKDHYRQTCTVLHSAGHSVSHFADIPTDLLGPKGTPNKTGIQGFGSTMTYGQRYQTKLVFNIVIGGEDTDGNGAVLTTEQIRKIRDLLSKSGTNEKQFLTYWKLQSLDSMPALNFDFIVDMLEKRSRRIDPRPDLSGVDNKVRDEHVSAIEEILNSDVEEKQKADKLREHVHQHLDPFPELWISVNDELARRGVCTKTALKNWLSLGLEAGRYR